MAAAKFIVASILTACTLSSANEIVPTSAPTDWPTYWPTYSPTPYEILLPTSLRCPSSFENFVQIDDAASMQYSIVQSDDPLLSSGIFCGRLFVDGADDGWVAIAFSEDGNMPGSDAIVADLEEGSVLKYHLGGKSPAGVALMEESKQTLQNTYVGVFGNMAVVRFTKLLVEDDEVTINEDGMNIFLHARGDVWPGYHTSRTVFVDVVETMRTIASVCDETRPCPDGEYCKLEPGKCLDESEPQEGVCVRIHDNCNWPVSYLPVCGCDGETYGNECEVDEMGTSVAYDGHCELDMRQGDIISPSSPDLPCLENQCRDPDGECGAIANCFADPCDVQDECAYAECEANYCGGCNHVCNTNGTNINGTKVDNAGPGFKPEETSCSPGGVCSTEGSSCSEGTETCCGQTFSSLICDCMGGSWMCLHTDACLFPSCCQSGPPENQPPPSPDTCIGGMGSLCEDTGVPDDYCCNDFTNPGSTYCTISGGMPPIDSKPPVTTEAPVTTTSAPPVTDSPSPAPTNVTEAPTAAPTGSPTGTPTKLTKSPTAAPTAAPTKLTKSPTAAPTIAPASSPTATPIDQTTSTAATSVSTTSETASTTLPETTSSTNIATTTVQTTTATQTSSTANPVTRTTSTVQTESTGATSSTTVPPTTTTEFAKFEFELDFSTTTTVPTTTGSDLELTTKPTPTAPGTVEGRPAALISAAEKSHVSLFSLSSMCLGLAAWHSI
jgi:hypothetical protein